MFEEFWGFQASPFLNVSTTRFFFRSRVHEEAIARMDYVVRRSKGAMVLLGPEGSGKTQSLRFFASQCVEAGLAVSFLKSPCADGADLLAQALAGFGLACDGGSLAAMLARLEAFARDGWAPGRPKVIVVDDADRLPVGDACEAVRRVLSIEAEDGHPIAVLLAGTSALRTHAGYARDLSSRVEVQHTLASLDADETRAYVRDHLAKAGGATDVFQGVALDLIAQASGGAPRKINAICDACLFIAGGEGKRTVDRNIVAQAIVELRDLLAA